MYGRPKLLIIGATGLLGPYFKAEYAKEYTVLECGLNKGEYKVDVTNIECASKLISDVNPDVIINLAAYTDVDGCEKNPELAKALNETIPANLVSCISHKIKLVQISTDQVYPNTVGLHKEDEVAPVNIYGKTKLAGEEALKSHDNSLILRTNIFGKSITVGRTSLSDFFIDSFRMQRPINLFKDSIFSPVHMKTLAEVSAQLLSKEITGTFNVGSRNAMSKADFALSIAEHFGFSTACAEIVSSTNIANRANRSLQLALDVTRLEEVLSSSMLNLTDEIRKL